MKIVYLACTETCKYLQTNYYTNGQLHQIVNERVLLRLINQVDCYFQNNILIVASTTSPHVTHSNIFSQPLSLLKRVPLSLNAHSEIRSFT